MKITDALEIARKTYGGFRIDDATTAAAMTALRSAGTTEATDWANKLRSTVSHWPDQYPRTLEVPSSTANSSASGNSGATSSTNPDGTQGTPTSPKYSASAAPTKGIHRLVHFGWVTIASFLIIGFINAKWVYPAVGDTAGLGCDGLDCTDYAITNFVVTGATGALETFNPVMFWAAFGPGLIAGMILIAAGVVADELQKHK